MGGALGDTGIEHAPGAGVHVVGRELSLDPRHLVDGFGEIAPLRAAAVEDAGLVEMDVGLDEAGRHQSTAQVEHRRVGFNRGRNLGDAPVRNSDVEPGAVAAGDQGAA